jgi:GTP cyclohydrolase I
MRGIKKPGSLVITSAMKGLFRRNPASRNEVMGLIRG